VTTKNQKPTEPIEEPAVAPAEPALDMDALLGSDPQIQPAAEVTETPAQKKIRELKEALAQPIPEPEFSISGKPEAELTEEEREIRDLEDQVAKREAKILESAGPKYADAPKGDSLLIHFLEDGFTFSGLLWFRGQEVEFEIGGKAYEQQKDRNGNSWLDLVDDIDGQYSKYGKQMFARGPWRGKAWGDFSHITDPEERAEAEKAAKIEQQRNRAAPIL
jgi:hypothetical protein